jgi:hypothetical protein
MWETLLQWLRKEPALAQWFSGFATLAAVIVAVILALVPIWLHRQRFADRRFRSASFEHHPEPNCALVKGTELSP